MLASTPFGDYRQLLAIGRDGPRRNTAARIPRGIAADARGQHCIAAGNRLANRNVAVAMIAAFEAVGGHFADRLLAALRAGAAAGGEASPTHSAALLVVHEVAWPIIDLRVDWSDADPIGELAGCGGAMPRGRRLRDPALAPDS